MIMNYKIGSFNVRNLNYSVVDNDGQKIKRSFSTIANIIKQEEFAIVALQEVLSKSALEQIHKSLGDNWKYAWEQPSSNFGGKQADKRGEGYAYIWDTKKIDLVGVETDEDIKYPVIWRQYQDRKKEPIIREPYYARFTSVGKVGGCSCEIRLINTHIVYGGNSLIGVSLRQKEFIKVVKNIYQNIINKRYGNFLPAYVIVLGDYNLSLQHLSQMDDKTKINVGNSSSKNNEEKVITLQGELTTVNHVEQDDGTYKSDYVNDYDHFSFIERYAEIMNMDVERVDILKYCKTIEQYWETVSDHVPIKLTIDLNKRN